MVRAVLLVLWLWSGTATAQSTFQGVPAWNLIRPPAPFLGTWGTDAQCDAHARKQRNDPRLHPYELSDEWLKQGFLYCFVGWRAYRQRNGDHWANLWLRCGEDAVRQYDALLRIADDQLTIRWSDDFTTRPLRRCHAR